MLIWINSLLAILFIANSVVAQQQLSFIVEAQYPHDRQAFTQGLLYHDGRLYESTGLYGRSELRETALETGRVLRKKKLSPREFGEGLTLIDNELIQLTWTNGYAFAWQLDNFEKRRKISYAFSGNNAKQEGWGLCAMEQQVVLSDGTDQLYFLDAQNFVLERKITVTDQSGPVTRLNELECIGHHIYANVWLTDRVVIVNSASGQVDADIDFASLYPQRQRKSASNLLNGIAWDSPGRRLFITGKRWPAIYQIKLEGAEDMPIDHLQLR